MARSIFFSFHYDDVKSFKVNVVRNSNMVKRSTAGNIFSDGSLWEEAKRKGKRDLQKLIEEEGLYNTSVTAVLIGDETFSRHWVKYELIKSFEKGNGILAIHLNRIKNKDGYISKRAKNPLDYLGLEIWENGELFFYELVDKKWRIFEDLKMINNRKSNTIYFKERSSWQKFWGIGTEKFRFYKFSELFETYCWRNDDGSNNFAEWIEHSYGGFVI